MSGGFLLGMDGDLFRRASMVLVDMGATTARTDDGDAVQLSDDEGRLFTLYERVPEGTDWEVRDGPFRSSPGAQVPDMDAVVACPFESRWHNLVAKVARRIADASRGEPDPHDRGARRHPPAAAASGAVRSAKPM